jgi:virginiamycin A acetyltransferase
MPSIKIGDGAIIATNSVVTKDVEPFSIVGGNPAKLILSCVDNHTIQDFLRLKGWDWDWD